MPPTAPSGNQGSGTQARRSRAGPSHLAMVAPAREHVASFQGFDPNPPYAVLQSGWGWTSLLHYTVGRFGQNQTQAANRVSRSGQRLSCTPPRPANALLLLPQRTFLLISQFWGSCHFNERGKKTREGHVLETECHDTRKTCFLSGFIQSECSLHHCSSCPVTADSRQQSLK